MNARAQTVLHINTVRKFLQRVRDAIMSRESGHDASKLISPEVEVFDVYTEKLKGMTYGSDEYKQCLAEMKPALDHHYAENRHHPEFFDAGVEGMNLIDLIELLADWKSASLRHDDGDILKSIEINTKRFNIPPALANVLRQTVLDLGWETNDECDEESSGSC